MEGFGYSIEMEPRTLSRGEISSARVEAVEIFLNRDPEEASLIFTKGKKEQFLEIFGRNNERRFEVCIKRWGNTSLNSATTKGLDYIRNAREPLSSPF